MLLLTKNQKLKLLENGAINAERIAEDGNTHDFKPVVKLFNPYGAGTWLLTELDPENPDIAFGLCDLGQGFPEMGSVSLAELASLRLPLGLSIERDHHFTADKTLSEYAEEARSNGGIRA